MMVHSMLLSDNKVWNHKVFSFITYRSKIKRFHWSIAQFNIFSRIARSKNWTKLHENRHVIKGIQYSGTERSSVLHSAWSNQWTHPLGSFTRFDKLRAIHFFVLHLRFVFLLYCCTKHITVVHLLYFQLITICRVHRLCIHGPRMEVCSY